MVTNTIAQRVFPSIDYTGMCRHYAYDFRANLVWIRYTYFEGIAWKRVFETINWPYNFVLIAILWGGSLLRSKVRTILQTWYVFLSVYIYACLVLSEIRYWLVFQLVWFRVRKLIVRDLKRVRIWRWGWHNHPSLLLLTVPPPITTRPAIHVNNTPPAHVNNTPPAHPHHHCTTYPHHK